MTNQLTPSQPGSLAAPGPMARIGEVANQVAADSVFQDYRSRKSPHTLRRQDADLARFTHYLESVGVTTYGDNSSLTAAALAADPAAWAGLTWGIVEGFKRWLLQRGYSIGTVNVRLSTIKTYTRLAAQAGQVELGQIALIRLVTGYGRTEAKRIDAQRTEAELDTRIGDKKARPVTISRRQAQALKEAHDLATGQGRRDRLMMALFIDHGLRCSEVAALTVGAFDLERREFQFYRPKVDKVQTHELTRDSLAAAKDYLALDAPEDKAAPLLRGSRKGGKLHAPGMAVQNINARVRRLGESIIDVWELSPHDLRHYWATTAARNNTPIDRLQEAGGWNSPTIPLSRYIEPAKIANEGVRLE